MALPWLMLAANGLAWLRWGTDLPFLDDWRAYNERTAGTFGWVMQRAYSALLTLSPRSSEGWGLGSNYDGTSHCNHWRHLATPAGRHGLAIMNIY